MRERMVVLSPTQHSLDVSNSQPSERTNGRHAWVRLLRTRHAVLSVTIVLLLLTSCRAFLYDAASTAADKNSVSLGTTFFGENLHLHEVILKISWNDYPTGCIYSRNALFFLSCIPHWLLCSLIKSNSIVTTLITMHK